MIWKMEASGSELAALLDETEKLLLAAECPMTALNKVLVMVEEVFVNIASYAYPEGGGFAWVEIETGPQSVTVRFSDAGVPFNPLEQEEPDITAGFERRKIGGLGIFMVRKWADQIDYRYEEGRNILTFTKNYA